jgi:hypothetical protein
LIKELYREVLEVISGYSRLYIPETPDIPVGLTREIFRYLWWLSFISLYLNLEDPDMKGTIFELNDLSLTPDSLL